MTDKKELNDEDIKRLYTVNETESKYILRLSLENGSGRGFELENSIKILDGEIKQVVIQNQGFNNTTSETLLIIPLTKNIVIKELYYYEDNSRQEETFTYHIFGYDGWKRIST